MKSALQSSEKTLPIHSLSGNPLCPRFSAQWQLLHSSLLWAFDAPLQKNARRMRYFTAPTAAWYLRKGRLTLRFADGEEKYRAGTWIFPREAPGEQCFSDNAELISIRFFSEWPNSKALFDRSVTVHFSADRFPDLLAAAEGVTSYMAQHFKRSSILSTESTLMHHLGLLPLFHQWIFSYYKTFLSLGYEPVHINPLSPTMERAVHYLQVRPLHLVFKETELARQMQLSLSHLNRLFMQQLQVSPTAFWNYRRIQSAQTALLSTEESIKSIAYSHGFSSPETFTRWFGQQRGLNPRQYRKILLR